MGTLAYEQVLIEAGIPGIFMAINICANQLQQPGADFLLETQFIIASKMNFFLEFFFMGKLKKCWLWSKTPLSALPFSCTFSAGDLASSF